ncbi:hypothetical protein Lser_V15G23426 [Lactuca serriola]
MEAECSSSLDVNQEFRQLTISEIHFVTKNFDETLVIGRGGFGMVYKGTIRNGTTHLVAAIKRLDSTSKQGEAEFWAEVEILTKLRHCHLVPLIGYCNDGEEMILAYEYMPHGTLEDHLHNFQTPLSWVQRLKICIGVARGLDYLHTGTGIKHGVIHRDVKSSNILLDESWNAKISDFGLSKLGPINQPSTYVNTVVKGTFGYLDPDYFTTGRLTRKSDVYAFGVVLFEVVSGKRAVDKSLGEEHSGLARWAQESVKEDRLEQIVDLNIKDEIRGKCLKEFARIADWCLDRNPKQRPTMAEVVVCLESVLALQEKASNKLHHARMRKFGWAQVVAELGPMLNASRNYYTEKSKLKSEMIKEKFVNQIKQMYDDSQLVKIAKEQTMHSNLLTQSLGVVSKKLRKTEEKQPIIRDRTQGYQDQNMQEDTL